jgi:DNA-binding SARP family transcriptional activator
MSPTPTPRPARVRTRRGPARILAAILRAAAGVAGTAAILAGLPYLLVTRIGWPLPHQWMGAHALAQDLTTRSLSDTAVIDTLAVVVWICWTILLLGALTEIGALALRRPAPSIPGLRPGQVLAAALIALIGISIARTPTTQTQPPDQHRPLPQRTAPLSPTPATDTTTRTTHATLPATVSARPAADEQSTQTDTASTAEGASGEAQTVTVQAGQSLFSLAEQYTGSGQNWKNLYQLNTDRAEPGGAHLTNPDLIRPGWSIEVPLAQFTTQSPTTPPTPDTEPAPNPAQPTRPSAHTNTDTPTPEPSHTVIGSAAPTPGEPSQPPPAPSATAGSPAGSRGAATTAPHASPTTAPNQAPDDSRPTRSSDPESAPDETGHHARPALALARDAGLIAGSIAALVSSALLLARRRRERGTSPAAPALALPEPPAARAARRHDLTYPRPPEDGPLGALAAIPLAETETGEATLREFPGGLALTGTGALPVARALIASALAQGGTHRDQHRALVLAANTDLALLSEPPASGAQQLDHPDLERHQDLAAALTRAEQLALARARALADLDAEDFDQLEADHGDEPHTPACLVLVSSEPEHGGRIEALAASGARLRITPILLGRSSTLPTLALDTVGRPQPGTVLPPEAVCYHLSAAAFTDILTTLAAAHPDQTPTRPGAVEETEGTPADLFPEHDASTPPRAPAASDPDAVEGADPAGAHTPAQNESTPKANEAAPDAVDPPAPHRPVPGTESAARGLIDGAHAREVWSEGVVRVRATGPLEIHARQAGGAWVVLERGLRVGALPLVLALALNPTGVSPATVESFFPDSPPEEARRHREEAFKTLRRALQEATGLPHGRLLVRDGKTYRFNPDLVSVDLWCRDEAGRAAAAETETAASLALTDQALGYHHGPLAADRLLKVEFEWAEQARTEARTAAMSLATAAATRAKEAGELGKAIDYLERAIAIAPDIETNHRHVMILHHRAGHYAEAQAAYQRTREYFEREFDGLSEATRAMARKLFET